MLRRINQALPELLLGIVLYGFMIQIVGVWFVEDKVQYSVGLWAGIILAMGLAVNMAVVILDNIGRASCRERVSA